MVSLNQSQLLLRFLRKENTEKAILWNPKHSTLPTRRRIFSLLKIQIVINEWNCLPLFRMSLRWIFRLVLKPLTKTSTHSERRLSNYVMTTSFMIDLCNLANRCQLLIANQWVERTWELTVSSKPNDQAIYLPTLARTSGMFTF